MPDLKISTNLLPDVLDSAYEARHDLVLCLLGKPGIGKTQQLYQFAKRKGANVVEIIASQILPNEVSGITMPVNETHSMEIYDHARLGSLKDGDILFFDELLQASPQTLSACLTLIQERRLMSGKMLPDIMIVAAANELPSATMIPMQIRQRFLFVDIEWDFDAWLHHNEEKYGVKIPETMKDLVSFSEKGYNTLTPRTLSKLISWRSKVKGDKLKTEAWGLVTRAQFGARAAREIDDLFAEKPAKQQLKEAIEGIAGGMTGRMFETNDAHKLQELVYNWDSLSIKEIYNTLMSMDCWADIQQELANTELRR